MFEDSRTYYEKMCNVNLTVEEVPEDMAETCLFTLSAEQLISESVKTMAVWALPLEEKIEMEKNDPSYMGYRMWVVVDDWADHSSIKELLPPGRGSAGVAQQCPVGK